MSTEVIVLRKLSGGDILAIYVDETDSMFKVEHPYCVKYDVSSGNVAMAPYCAFSDEYAYEIRKDLIEFVVPASQEISDKFLTMLDFQQAQMQEYVETLLEEDRELDRLEAAVLSKTYVSGNTTKH